MSCDLGSNAVIWRDRMGAAMKWLRNLIVGLALIWSLPTEAASRFAVCAVTCTWDGSSTTMWSASSGGVTGASVPGSSDTVTLDAATCVGGVTCTVTVNTTVTVQQIVFGACTASTTGCILDFSANNNNVTLTADPGFNGSGTGVRNLKMGNGLWTMTGGAGGTPWQMGTTTNLTFAANSSTLLFSGTSSSTKNGTFGGLTYNIVQIGANTSYGSFNIGGANTFGTLTITAPNVVTFPFNTTQTVTNAINWVGTSSAQISVASNSSATAATISTASGAPTMTWTALRFLTFSGGATFTATNSFNLGGTTGITITAPSTGGGGKIIGG